MAKGMTVRDHIFTTYDQLFDAEKKVADYLLDHPGAAVEMSVAALAGECNTSQATIIRFCKKVGFSGFHQLKIEMAKEMETRKDYITTNAIDINHIGQSLHNILVSKVEELEATINHLSEESVKKVIDAVIKADVVEVAAVGNSIPIAMDASYKFNQVGIRSVASNVWETQQAFSFTLKEGDVLIGISASGASRRLVGMAQIAQKRGALVVAITNQPESPLAENSDIVLTTASRERVFYDQVSFTRTAAMAVVDSIFLLLYSMREDSFQQLLEHEQIISEDKI
jgi:RpiR family carbohydrate utilization transcriptional regulator